MGYEGFSLFSPSTGIPVHKFLVGFMKIATYMVNKVALEKFPRMCKYNENIVGQVW